MADAVDGARRPLSARKPCPRCGRQLARALDRQRSTTFEDFRCPDRHGRYMTFVSFLRAKNFVRDLTPAEVNDLRRHVRIIKCTNCGATVDITKESPAAIAAHRSPCSTPTSSPRPWPRSRPPRRAGRRSIPRCPLRLAHERLADRAAVRRDWASRRACMRARAGRRAASSNRGCNRASAARPCRQRTLSERLDRVPRMLAPPHLRAATSSRIGIAGRPPRREPLGSRVCRAMGRPRLPRERRASREGDLREMIERWGANVVRLPLNQDFALNGRADRSAEDYLRAIDRVVDWAARFGAYTILDLQWLDADTPRGLNGDGTINRVPPLPDARSIERVGQAGGPISPAARRALRPVQRTARSAVGRSRRRSRGSRRTARSGACRRDTSAWRSGSRGRTGCWCDSRRSILMRWCSSQASRGPSICAASRCAIGAGPRSTNVVYSTHVYPWSRAGLVRTRPYEAEWDRAFGESRARVIRCSPANGAASDTSPGVVASSAICARAASAGRRGAGPTGRTWSPTVAPATTRPTPFGDDRSRRPTEMTSDP